MGELSGVKKYGVWAISGLLTVAFMMAGGMKVAGTEEMVANFQRWGFPLFFLYVVGLSEVAGVIGLWVPRISGLAALGLVGLMIGGVGTHLLANEANAIGPALVLGVLSAVVAWGRYPQTKALFFQYRNALLQNA